MPVRLRPGLRLRRTALRRALVWRRHRSFDGRDVVLASYPKSGRTWLGLMLAEALTGERMGIHAMGATIENVGSAKRAPRILPGGARLLRSHEPYRPEYRRAVYLVRDVRDVAVSYYREQRELGEFGEGLPEYVDAFVGGRVDGYGSWQEHVASWLGARELGAEIHLIRYEDLRADTVAGLGAVLEFLGSPLEESRAAELVANNSFERVRRIEAETGSAGAAPRGSRPWRARSGAVSGWRAELGAGELRSLAPAAEVARRIGYEGWR